MFLNPIDVPEIAMNDIPDPTFKSSDSPDILLNLTPLRLRRGSLQTSISHWENNSI